MKYKLINSKTNEEHLCEKVSIDGFDYYESKSDIGIKDYFEVDGQILQCLTTQEADDLAVSNDYPKIIACNNPNIDIPKIVDEVEAICIKDLQDFYGSDIQLTSEGEKYLNGFKTGYNKSQETHPFSEEDMIDFAEFYFREEFNATMQDCKSSKEILQLWKKQKPKTVYYE